MKTHFKSAEPPLWLTSFLAGAAVALAFTSSWSRPEPARAGSGKRTRDGSSVQTARYAAVPVSKAPSSRWRALKEIVWSVYQEMSEDRLLAVAAGVVFYGLLALFPAITAFVSSYGLFASPTTVTQQLSELSGMIPTSAFSIVQEQVGRVVAKGQANLSFGFVFGLALAIWSANAGLKAIMDALNVIYQAPEKRGFIMLNVVSLTLTAGALAMALLTVAALIVFPLAMSYVGLDSITAVVVQWARWPLLLALLLLALATLYRFGPSPHGAKWRWISPGAVMAVVTWLIGSALLSWYLSNFAHYDATYGSLGAAIGLMMWMWVSAIVVLLGAQLNAVLEQRAARAGAPQSMDAALAQPRPAAAAG